MTRIKVWHVEIVFVFIVLATVSIMTGNRAVEWIGTFAVLFTFAHASISDRMSESQRRKIKPDVECYKWSNRYFIAKEILWLAYFVINQSYAALAGVIVFLLYPFWRSFYRRHLREKKRELFS